MRLRSIPAVPLVHVNRAVMVLEPPSDITIKIKEAASPSIHGSPLCLKNAQAEEQDLHLKSSDLALVGGSGADPVKKKRRGPKGPNPLSVKKKQVVQPSQDNRDIKHGEKRKRDLVDTEQINDDSGSAKTKRRRRKRHTTVDNAQDTSCVISNVPNRTK